MSAVTDREPAGRSERRRWTPLAVALMAGLLPVLAIVTQLVSAQAGSPLECWAELWLPKPLGRPVVISDRSGDRLFIPSNTGLHCLAERDGALFHQVAPLPGWSRHGSEAVVAPIEITADGRTDVMVGRIRPAEADGPALSSVMLAQVAGLYQVVSLGQALPFLPSRRTYVPVRLNGVTCRVQVSGEELSPATVLRRTDNLLPAVSLSGYPAVVEDLNRDGLSDLVLVDCPSKVDRPSRCRLLLVEQSRLREGWRGECYLRWEGGADGHVVPTGIASGDLNGDGLPELIVVERDEGHVSILTWQGGQI